MNIIKGAFSNYTKCKEWLEWYDDQIESLEYKMQGKTTSSIIGMPDGVPDPNSVSRHRSAVNDEINEFKEEHQTMWNHCHNTIALCNIKFEEVKEQYRDVIEYVFKTKSTVKWIAKKTGYSEIRIYEIINEETTRLSKK